MSKNHRFETCLLYTSGNAEAQGWLGYCYYFGEGIREDKQEEVKWYRLAAGQGNAEAQRRLGYCYYVGKGIRAVSYTHLVPA